MKTTTEDSGFKRKSSSFSEQPHLPSLERYEWLRSKAIHDGSRCKYKKSDVMKFVDLLQKGETKNGSETSEKESA